MGNKIDFNSNRFNEIRNRIEKKSAEFKKMYEEEKDLQKNIIAFFLPEILDLKKINYSYRFALDIIGSFFNFEKDLNYNSSTKRIRELKIKLEMVNIKTEENKKSNKKQKIEKPKGQAKKRSESPLEKLQNIVKNNKDKF